MTKWVAIVAGGAAVVFLLGVSACVWFVWELATPAGRTIGVFDIGGGRAVKIWSRHSERDWPGDPVPIYYEVTTNGESIGTTFIGTDHGDHFEFKVGFADQGRLACVVQTNPNAKNIERLIVFDADTGESWPHAWKSGPVNMDMWHARFARLQTANQGLAIRE